MLLHLGNPNPSPTTQFSPPFNSIFIFRSRTLSKSLFAAKPEFKFRCSASNSAPQIASKSAIERIAEKLRSLGYAEEVKSVERVKYGKESAGEIFVPLPHHLPKQRVGHTIDTSWSTPENPVPKVGSGGVVVRVNELNKVVKREKWLAKEDVVGRKEREERVPTLAELSLPVEELGRLREIGKKIKTKLKVGKAGVTEGIVNGIHERWRRSEVVRITCEDICRLNMKRTHDLLERKTGGLVIWRSGSHIMLFRGANYEFPYFTVKDDDEQAEPASLENASHENLSELKIDEEVQLQVRSTLPTKEENLYKLNDLSKKDRVPLRKGVGAQNIVRFQLPGETQLAEEVDVLLDGLGPRFTDWWGYDPVPIDADLLPAIVPGYRKPFRLLPYGVYPKLTNDEMTTLRRLGRPVPCHFALGRNRNLQGLAASIVKLWEKCEIVKIAVKRGVQNTNSVMMAQELKALTGGTLLSRDIDFIVFYRGKDFLPLAVSSAIEDRRNYGMGKKARLNSSSSAVLDKPDLESGVTLETSSSTGEYGITEIDGHVRGIRKIQNDVSSREATIDSMSRALSVALEKKEKAEKLLEEIGEVEITQQPEPDKEGITKEERYMLRKVGLRMKAFLLLGRRGVFAGTVENMHLHWKYRELIKIISNEKSSQEVHQSARMLEAESGGILVAVERVSKGYAIIMYRGKNYQRPESLRPKTLLTKRQAMKRSLEAQRQKSLQLHVMKLTKHINYIKQQLATKEASSAVQVEESRAFEISSSPMSEDIKLTKLDVTEYSNENLSEEAAVISTPVVSTDVMDIATISIDQLQHDNISDPITECTSISQASKTETLLRSDFGDVVCSINTAGNAPDGDLDSVNNSENRNMKPQVHGSNIAEPSGEFINTRTGTFDTTKSMKLSDGMPSPAESLSNKERLLLRKKALSMKYRPVLAVGKSNVITGVAKTINQHFKKHPLAIVNVKGRAKGTSVQEVVTQLEQATGSVLVSQEPSNVILYRGWGAEQHYDRRGKIIRQNVKVPEDAITGPPGVSQELLAAIKLECGFLP